MRIHVPQRWIMHYKAKNPLRAPFAKSVLSAEPVNRLIRVKDLAASGCGSGITDNCLQAGEKKPFINHVCIRSS